ncbi:MAG: carboxymuconolactone decarboxylase family protein [Gemmataceae bacterium]
MSRLNQIAPESATGKAKELLDAVKGKLGLVPNMTRAMANAPAVLNGYLQLSGALGQGALPARIREQIALAIAEANGCDYCLAAHTAIGKMTGLTADQIRDSRHGTAVDPKADALIRFARRIVDTRGRVSGADLHAVREAGYDDGAIAEVVAHVALSVFTNYFNHVADTDIDFPRAEPLVDHHEACAAISGCDSTR